MRKCSRGKAPGGALVLKKGDESLRRRVRELGGDKVGIVPVDVAKKRACAMVTDFYGNVLVPPELFPVTAAGLQCWLREQGAGCSEAKAQALAHWAAEAVTPAVTATTESAILRADLDHLAGLGRRIEQYERPLLGFLVQSPYVLLLSVRGVSHVRSSGLGAEAGPVSMYLTARKLSGRAGLFPRRYQSDETDLQGGTMAKGEPFLRDALMKIGRCLVLRQGAFHAWGEARRAVPWCGKQIVAAMANRFCRIAHAMILHGQTFSHPDAGPAVPVLGKPLNVAADLGIEAAATTALALEAAARRPFHSGTRAPSSDRRSAASGQCPM